MTGDIYSDKSDAKFGIATPKITETSDKVITLSDEVSKIILSDFTPEDQNEIIKRVYNIVKESRIKSIAECEERAEYLRQTVIQLG
jgi:flagellar motor component MotA